MSTEPIPESEPRFEFGSNWRRFLERLTPDRIVQAEESVRRILGVASLEGCRFIDVGSGSGLFSLAARRLGAEVVSFDYDPDSVACAMELRRRQMPGDARWRIEKGSILDAEYLSRLGTYDVVYSWGVLHHTGALWRALENVARLVRPDGTLALSIYNDQGRQSRWWTRIKRAYNRIPPWTRWLLLIPSFGLLWGPTILRDTIRGNPLKSWRGYTGGRGMSAWTDLVDWVGGWPFEVAKPEQVFEFFRARGFTLVYLSTCGGGLGCNEFAFRAPPAAQ